MGKFIDLTGQRFGKWLVTERAEDRFTKSGIRITMWNCVCDCGSRKAVSANTLRRGGSLSCGCYAKERASECLAERNKNNAKHGHAKERLCAVWRGMINRCYNPKNESFEMYGGRGITVCESWRKEYMAFRSWALENGYDENAQYGECTLDRIDNAKGYCPENCRWANAAQQANNRRSNLVISAFGKTKNLKSWSEDTGIKYNVLYERIVSRKWDAERALSEPVRGVVGT